MVPLTFLDTPRPLAACVLLLNFCMYLILTAIGGWALNQAIDHGFFIDPGSKLPAHFSPIYFPMGNVATGFFVMFTLIAGVVGVASTITGFQHIQSWDVDHLTAAAPVALLAWSFTLLAMGLGCKEIVLLTGNACLKTMEAFIIILSATQFIYIISIYKIIGLTILIWFAILFAWAGCL